MTISKLSAGDGYAYYTSVTVSADHHIGKNQELGDYYLETGTPEGQWLGGGAASLGIDGSVSEAQMKALFGEGLHPNADVLVAHHMSTGMSATQALKAVLLGRKFYGYQTPDNELATAIKNATVARETELGRDLTPDERIAVRMRQAGIMFRDRNGRAGAPHEVARFLATELTKGQNAVSGFDLTFSAPKSVSVAWAIAHEPQATALEAAHQRAIERTVEFLETEVVRARTGTNGMAYRTTSGLLATRFRHWESREGDPQLHDHVVIANRVQITEADGSTRWLTIDGQSLYRATMNASSVYNKHLADELKSLGFDLRQRVSPSGSHRGMELRMVTDKHLDMFSSRSIAIAQRTAELVADYVNQHGRQPGTKELLALKQQATLDTRTPKSQAVTRDDLRQRWNQIMGRSADSLRTQIEWAMKHPDAYQLVTPPPINITEIAGQLVDEVSAKQSTWTRNHIETRLNIWAAAQPGIVDDLTLQAITHEALTHASFSITPRLNLPHHDDLINDDGSSIYQPPAAELYTSTAVLEAEDLLLNAAQDVALPAVSQAHFEAALAYHDGPLNQGQIDLAHQVACSESIVTVGIGPAGTGKTTAMKLAIAATSNAGVSVHGITVSAAAAEQLQQATSMTSTTIAKWLLDTGNGTRAINAGDVILVDEAGMASARDLAAITERATRAGAFVRLIGDDRQLQAIGAGGSLRMLAAEVGAVRLDQVHRFVDENEAAASLRLREEGDVDWHLANNRVHGGTNAHVLTRVVEAWEADQNHGQTSLMMAGTNNTVATLNQMAHDQRAVDGSVTMDRSIELADGSLAGIGDRIITRRNDRRLTTGTGHNFVKNGDVWTITDIGDDGHIDAVDDLGRSIELPADYVAGSTGLGYATTVHRAQGQTVDHAHLIIDDTTSREALYVGLTRGRHSNHVYAITDGTSAADMLRNAAATSKQAISARELINQAHAEAHHPARMVRILGDMQQRADQQRYTSLLRAWDPQLAAAITTSDKRHRLYTALAAAEDAGFTAERMLTLVAGVDSLSAGDDPTGLIAWRINKHLATATTVRYSTQLRPARAMGHGQLATALDTATAAREGALQDLRAARQAVGPELRPAALKDGRDVPSWVDRRHGQLTDDELREQLHTHRTIATTIGGAIRETMTARRELTRELLTHDPDSPSRHALGQRIERLTGRIDQLRDDRRGRTRTEAELREETIIRARMDGRSWFVENVQRDAARDLTPADVKTNAAIAGATLDEAQTRWRNASDLQRGLWVEQKLRTYEPDTGINQRPAGTPGWSIPGRGLNDPHLPPTWREPLTDMADTVAAAIRDRGAAIALNPAPWATNYLGAVPAPDTPLRARWEALAGQIDTWRGLTGHDDPSKALPPPSRSHDASRIPQRDLHVLHTAAADLRRDIVAANSIDDTRPPMRIPLPVRTPAPTTPAPDDLATRARRTPVTIQTPAVSPAPARRPTQTRPKKPNLLHLQTAKLKPVQVSPISAWVTARNQQADVLRAAQSQLHHLRNAPLAPGESGLARLAAADKAKADVATATATLRSIERQAPRSPLAVVENVLSRSREAIIQALTRPPATPDRAPIDTIRRRVKQQQLIDTLRRPMHKAPDQERTREPSQHHGHER
ncbi:MAG: MobF family relaxase [Propionibacteriaceae bacterium]|nr:MobF family relaxase [Propionibacteriaceae bacterium]